MPFRREKLGPYIFLLDVTTLINIYIGKLLGNKDISRKLKKLCDKIRALGAKIQNSWKFFQILQDFLKIFNEPLHNFF